VEEDVEVVAMPSEGRRGGGRDAWWDAMVPEEEEEEDEAGSDVALEGTALEDVDLDQSTQSSSAVVPSFSATSGTRICWNSANVSSVENDDIVA
jgi:hypothetical protein